MNTTWHILVLAGLQGPAVNATPTGETQLQGMGITLPHLTLSHETLLAAVEAEHGHHLWDWQMRVSYRDN